MSRVYLSYRVVFHATRYLEQSAVPASCCSSAPFCWYDPMPLRRVFLPVSPMVRVLNLSHSTHGTLWKLSREAKNKKSIQLATFLRLGIVAISPIADCCPKRGENGCVEAYCHVARVEGSCQSQKSCKIVEVFVFSMGESLQRGAFVGNRARLGRQRG